MARAIWTGAISFGLVNVPVKLFSATSPKTVRFHQLSGKTGARIRQKRVDPSTDEEVPYDDIVKGYEITPDRYVVIQPEELEALDPKATKTIDIEEFVDLEEIDPIYYDHSYYLAPTAGGAKAYRLLLDAMREAGKVGIGAAPKPKRPTARASVPHALVADPAGTLSRSLPPARGDPLGAFPHPSCLEPLLPGPPASTTPTTSTTRAGSRWWRSCGAKPATPSSR